MKIVKVNNLPQTYEADTVYLVKSSTAGLVNIYVTNSDATEIRSIGTSSSNGGIDDLVHVPRTSNVYITSENKGNLIEITSGFSEEQSFGSLPAGWWCYYKNATDTDIAFPRLVLDDAVRNPNLSYVTDAYIPNTDFATDSGWTKGSGWTISGGKAVASSASSALTSTTDSFTTGMLLKVTLTVTRNSGGLRVMGVTGQDIATTGTHTVYLRAAGTKFYITGLSAFTGNIDNISVQILDNVVSNSNSASWLGDNKITLTSYSATSSSQAVQLELSAGTGGDGLYEVKYTVQRTAGDIRFSLNDEIEGTARNASGVYTEYVVLKSNYNKIHFEIATQVFTGTITNVSVSRIVGKVDNSEGEGLLTMYPGEMRLLYSTGSQIKSKPVQSFRKNMTSSGYFLKPTGYSAFDVTLRGSGGNGLNIGKPLSFGAGKSYYLPGTGGACAMARYKNSDVSFMEYAVLGSPGAGGFSTFIKSRVGNGANGSIGSATDYSNSVSVLSDGLKIMDKIGGALVNSSNATEIPVYGAAAGLYIYEPNTYSVAAQNLSSGGYWTISLNTAIRQVNATGPVTGTVTCAVGEINKFVMETTNLASNEYYTLSLSGGVTGTFSVNPAGGSDSISIFYIPTTGTVNFSLNASSVYSTNANFAFGNRTGPLGVNQTPAQRKKSVYGGNGGYLEVTQSFTNGETPGGGGGLYIQHSEDTLGRGGNAQCIIQGVI